MAPPFEKGGVACASGTRLRRAEQAQGPKGGGICFFLQRTMKIFFRFSSTPSPYDYFYNGTHSFKTGFPTEPFGNDKEKAFIARTPVNGTI